MKYQFCITFENTTVNSAATKAVQDCNRIFSDKGYIDYTLTVWDNSNRVRYYLLLIKELFIFFRAIKKGSVIAIQYPLLSINNVFKTFIKLARYKDIKFFCVIHDLEALRKGGKNKMLNKLEIKNLNSFDVIIAHNYTMVQWLRNHGFNKKAVSLEMFDYLTEGSAVNKSTVLTPTIVFAGNLDKSTFIYSLGQIKRWHFNVYGPNFNRGKGSASSNLTWCGEYSPGQIAIELNGSFGLIWDGESVDKCDELLGNYLKFNNPHKFSLYIASGTPVIAPADSAIGALIQQHQIGLLINDLNELDAMMVDPGNYAAMKSNVLGLREKVIKGYYLNTAITTVEADFLIK